MTKNELISECLKLPESYVDHPFDATTAVIKNKHNNKMFAFLDYANPEKIKNSCGKDAPVEEGGIFINLKCETGLIEVLRQQYSAVLPGYYSNKQHWNTIIIDKDVPLSELKKMIIHSYNLVVTKKNKI